MNILQGRDLKKSYGKRRHCREILHGVNLSLKEGTCLGVIGESGSGKSTLARLIAGLELPDAGEILYRGVPLDGPGHRGKIQMIFQNSRNAVNLHKTIGWIVGEPLRIQKQPRESMDRRVRELLGRVALTEGVFDKYPRQLSGGMLQRVCIARALASSPEVLILDEPTSSLDVSVQAQLLQVFHQLKEEGLSLLFISHDIEVIYALADEFMVMKDGEVLEEGPLVDLSQVSHPYSQELFRLSGAPLK